MNGSSHRRACPILSKAAGYDQDLSFILVEIAGDALKFQTVSRMGTTVDSGVILREPRINGLARVSEP